jgi:FkbM family methyltransferase
VRAALLRLTDAFRILLEPGGFRAFLTWPHFSLTSFKMILDLQRQGIVPKTVIDVGANVGQFAVSAAKIFPRVTIHSFEPDPASVQHLKRNTRNLQDLTIYPFALGERQCMTKLRINSYRHSSSILPLASGHLGAFPFAGETEKIEVKLLTLDAVFNEEELRPPVLLKLDVQGYESRVLEGGRETLKRIDFVIAEASFKPMYEGEVLFLDMVAMMKNRGFDFLRPVGWLSNPKTGEILQMDMLFARR